MTSSSSDRPGEFELIAKLFAPLSKAASGAFGLTDDAATISPAEGEELVVTADALVESVHFLRNDPAETIAQKALRVNLSDLAAKGAVPKAYLLALALPDWPDGEWLEAFAHGLAQDQKRFGITLIGGDTTRTPGPLTIAITAMGTLRRGTMLRRSGAKRGDLVFVTGTIGDAGMGLDILEAENTRGLPMDISPLIARYRVPIPRTTIGIALHGIASASLDVSDGLVADLGHIAGVSKVRIEVDAMRIPLSKDFVGLAGETVEMRCIAATSGDDYEIAFTAPSSRRVAIMEAGRRTKTQVTEIGRVVAGEGVALLDGGGREIPVARKGFAHF